MRDSEQIRESVSRAYAGAVASDPPSECDDPVQKGTLVRCGGYSREELDNLPVEAVVNSFGCGNPLAFSEVGEGETVLDLGCGAGIDLLLAAKKVGPSGRVIGVDMTDEMITRAREIISESGMKNIEVRKGLIEELPVDSGSIDWVISNCVINLSPEKERVFAEIARVLRPGGRMIVSDVIAQDLPERVTENLALYNCCVAGAISEEAYSQGLQSAGLVDVEIRERIEYDLAQLGGLIENDKRTFEGSATCCSGFDDNAERQSESISDLATICRGKVWSAKIFARKPL